MRAAARAGRSSGCDAIRAAHREQIVVGGSHARITLDRIQAWSPGSGPSPLFAVIETDYFAGMGDQAAAAYRGDREIMAPSRC